MLSETPLYCHVDAQLLIYQYQSTTDCTRTSQLAMGSWVPLRWPPATHQLQSMRLTRGHHSLHKDPGHAPARRRHANDAVRCTASYLARRGAHPRQYRGDAASELRGACRRRRYWQGWVGSLGSPPWLPTPPRSWPAGGGGARLASPRPRLDGGSSTDRGWTVFHLPSTLGGCEPFDF